MYGVGGELFTYLDREGMFLEPTARYALSSAVDVVTVVMLLFRFYAAELVLAIDHLHSLGIIYRWAYQC
jgi:serine/threonine protein kinase